jgi:LmbE family N-acetylglucosaminyl deacetylase
VADSATGRDENARAIRCRIGWELTVAMRIERRVPGCALAIFAHPDDPEVSCGGTLARWVDGGARAHPVVVNRGEKGSTVRGADPDALAQARAAEVAAAAEVLGLASFELLGYPDGESENDLALRGRLVEVVRRLRPDAVVCPDPTSLYFGAGYVNHRDHRTCGFAVLDAVAPAAASPLYFPELGPPHQVERLFLSGTLDPDTAVDIGPVLERKSRALACHRSQLGEAREWVAELVAQRAEDAGRDLGVRHAEVFRMLRLVTEA